MKQRTRESGKESGGMVSVHPSAQVEAREVAAGRAAQVQVLIGEKEGAPHFAMRKFRMGVGGGMPMHTNSVEHQQYVLKGRARIGIGEEVYEVQADDVLLIPAGVPHSYEVIEAPFEFLCMVPNLPDRVEIIKGNC